MKKTLIILVLVAGLLVGGFFAFNSYIYEEKQADLSMYTLGSYGYRCTDGTEFTMSPSEDMTSIHIVPAAGVERIPETILPKVASDTGVLYETDGITFYAKGETVELGTEAFATICSPIAVADEAPFNFGD